MAASSGDIVAPAGASAGSSRACDEADSGHMLDTQVEALPHLGFACIDKLRDGTTCLLHQVTLERKKLPPGSWSLEFDDEGFAIVVSDEQDKECLVVEDCLERVLCADHNGSYDIHLLGRPGAPSCTFGLSEKRSRHEEVLCDFRIGSTGARCEMSLFFLA